MDGLRSWMKMGWQRLAVFFLLLNSLVAMAGAGGTITVGGDASLEVAPDRAMLTLGVENKDARFEVAKATNDAAMAKVMAALRKCVESKNLHTGEFSLRPLLYGNNENFYYARNSVRVTLNDVASLEKVVNAAVQAGANQVLDVSFETADLTKYRNQALVKALENAKAKAEIMVTALGCKLGSPVKIDENRNVGYGSVLLNKGWIAGGASHDAAAGNGSTVAPGKIAIPASVVVTFELKD